MRESRWPYVGACLESVTGAFAPFLPARSSPLLTDDLLARLCAFTGGNHARVYKQNGTEADSGAWFLAASKEVVRPRLRMRPSPGPRS